MGGNQSGLSKKDMQSLAKETHFNKDELVALQAEFKEHDADNSGDLDVGEFISLMKKRMEGTGDDTLAKLFEAFDSDNSGSIHFKELCIALNSLEKGDPKEKLSYMFDVYDEDNSGTLSTDELTAIIAQMEVVAISLGRVPDAVEGFIASVIAKVDINGDGTVTKEEWIERGCATPSLLVLLGVGDY